MSSEPTQNQLRKMFKRIGIRGNDPVVPVSTPAEGTSVKRSTATDTYRKISVSESYDERQLLLRRQYQRMIEEQQFWEEDETVEYR